MNRNTLVKRVVVAGGFLLLCAVPRLGLAQSNPPGAAPLHRVQPASARPGNHTLPPDLLAGLTLTDEQQAKVDQIRADTKSRLAAVAKDERLGPEVKNAMLVGFQRIENNKIIEVLTLDQKREVRMRIAEWRAAKQPPQHPPQQPPVPEGNSQPK